MTDAVENKEVVTPVGEQTPPETLSDITPTEKQYSPTELKAIEQGWVPREQFNGEEDDFVEAKEFVKRGELFTKIDRQNRELKAVKNALDALKQHYSRVEEASFNRALQELRSKQKQAFNDGDLDQFHQIEDQIDEAKRQQEQAKMVASIPIEAENQPAPEFVAWTNRNPWYNSTKYMREFADEYGIDLARQGVPRNEVLKRVEEAVRKEFPHKFVNPNKENAPELSTSRSTGQRSAKKDDYPLSAEERKVMRSLVDSGTLTEEQYIADLKKLKA